MVYNQAKTWRVMPSQLMHIHDDPLTAWSLNNAVWLFGMSLESALNESPRPTKEDRKEEQRRTRILNKWIPQASGAAPEEPKPPAKGKFREPKITK